MRRTTRDRETIRALLEGFIPANAPDRVPSRAAFRTFSTVLNRILFEAGIDNATISKYLAICAGLTLLAVTLSILSSNPLFLGIPFFSVLVLILKLKSTASARALHFETDYTAFLQSLSSSIRTGSDPLNGLLDAEALFDDTSVLRTELKKLRVALEAGASEDAAIQGFALSIAHPDIPAFRTAFILSRSQGASLSLCLQRLARVTRQRQSFRRKIRAALAMQKLSALGMTLCVVALFSMQALANRAALSSAWNHPIGNKVLTLGIALIVTGLIWMASLTRRRA